MAIGAPKKTRKPGTSATASIPWDGSAQPAVVLGVGRGRDGLLMIKKHMAGLTSIQGSSPRSSSRAFEVPLAWCLLDGGPRSSPPGLLRSSILMLAETGRSAEGEVAIGMGGERRSQSGSGVYCSRQGAMKRTRSDERDMGRGDSPKIGDAQGGSVGWCINQSVSGAVLRRLVESASWRR